MRRTRAQTLETIPLIALAAIRLLSGCYDDCEREGAVRCDGSKVEICGYRSHGTPSWDEAADCETFAAKCLAAESEHIPEFHCMFPELTCDAGPAHICHLGNVVSCEEKGGQPRLAIVCPHGCIENTPWSFCSNRQIEEGDGGVDSSR